jgi:glucan 1,3-beta-glucosidase
LEPWITPSLFDEVGGAAVDEWTFCSVLGASEAQKRLYNHWYSWITQGDFQAIAAAGMNHVRIPIGYWSVTPIQGEPYVQGAYDVLGQALDWAAGAGLKVMIDLHGGKAEPCFATSVITHNIFLFIAIANISTRSAGLSKWL